MSVPEICAMPVAGLAADDAILWLWTTNPNMRAAFQVIDAWDFEERTILTWVKPHFGTGHWLRGQSEHCILAVRGRPTITLTNQATVLHASPPERRHSRKPDEFYQLVESLCPGSKLELFCRRPRPGWSCWGDEVVGAAASADLARAALAYARRGLSVHPCVPEQKLPLLNDWPNRASHDPRTIASWWRRWPTANIAIATGGEMRLLVVDVDPDAGGEATLAVLEREHGALPATVECITPRGGRHVYFIVPRGRPMPGNSAGKLGQGIDTRGHHGYVLAPPSTVNSKAYAWSVDSGDRIAEAPGWLLELLQRTTDNGNATPPQEWQEIALAGVDEGKRNQTIAKTAGLLFRRMPDPILAAALVACFNAVKCRPPLAATELKRTLDSIAAREMKRRGLNL
jgi:N6-adenosine-specific RNA methylase IME4